MNRKEITESIKQLEKTIAGELINFTRRTGIRVVGISLRQYFLGWLRREVEYEAEVSFEGKPRQIGEIE